MWVLSVTHYRLDFVYVGSQCYTEILGYRVITTQNITVKLLEKIIAGMLFHHLYRLHLLLAAIGGYCICRETWASAVVFAYDVYEGFLSDIEMCCCKWPERCVQWGTSGWFSFLNSKLVLLNWICTAIFQWKAVLKYNSWTLEPIAIHLGIPQCLIPCAFQCIHSEDHGQADLGTWKDNVTCWRCLGILTGPRPGADC